MKKHPLRQIAEAVPLSIYMTFIKRDILGLYYHIITDEELPHIRNLYKYKSPNEFENDLLYLVKNFNIISYEELEAWANEGKKLKSKSIIITFDDGLSECFSIARPLLLKYNIPCVFFVTTDYIDNREMASDLKVSIFIDFLKGISTGKAKYFLDEINKISGKEINNLHEFSTWAKSLATTGQSLIDKLGSVLEINTEDYLKTNKPYMTTEEIINLSTEGFTIGAHSIRHQDFRFLSDYEIEKNIVDSCKTIGNLTGRSPIPFAFPYTMDGISREFLRNIRNHNSSIGLFFGGSGISLDEGFVISRMCGDHPTKNARKSSNLYHRIKLAYIEEISRMFHQIYSSKN